MAMDVEHLIECVKSHAFLYDVKHKDYKHTARKAAVWDDIASQLNENSETVKLKWKTVRDGYIKFIKQQKAGKKSINYIWSTHLEFLGKCQVSRKRKKIKQEPNKSKLEELSDSDTNEHENSPGPIVTPPPSNSVVPLRKENTSSKKRPATNQDIGLKYSKTKKSKKNVYKYDATDHLFLSYSQTFKTFSPRQRALLKVELAKLFSNAELSALDTSMNYQDSIVPEYSAMSRNYDNHMVVSADVHTVDVDDEDSEDDIEFVNPAQVNGKRSLSNDTTSDGTI